MNIKAIERAAAAFGGQAALARKLGVHPMCVSHWKTRGVPRGRCVLIEAATGGIVTRHDLRPDIFGPPQ